MPQPTTCHDILDAARAQRTKYPLTKGRYKLDEARHTIDRWRATIETITERTQGGSGFGATENLGPCMAEERGTYLKSIPARLAERIGYDILPAIAALEGDGVPKTEVQRLVHRAETDAQRLIAECEAARLRLKAGINHEYDVMRRSESFLLGLLDAANALVKLTKCAPRSAPCSHDRRQPLVS
jgi:hypothetical protein